MSNSKFTLSYKNKTYHRLYAEDVSLEKVLQDACDGWDLDVKTHVLFTADKDHPRTFIVMHEDEFGEADSDSDQPDQSTPQHPSPVQEDEPRPKRQCMQVGPYSADQLGSSDGDDSDDATQEWIPRSQDDEEDDSDTEMDEKDFDILYEARKPSTKEERAEYLRNLPDVQEESDAEASQASDGDLEHEVEIFYNVFDEKQMALMQKWMDDSKQEDETKYEHIQWELKENCIVQKYGKAIPIPRKQAGYYGTDDGPMDYTFSSMTLEGRDEADLEGLAELRQFTQRYVTRMASSTPAIGFPLNFAVFNYYHNGRQCLSHHQDDEGMI
jgi:hypothetical protein